MTFTFNSRLGSPSFTIYMNFQNDISFDAGGKVIIFGEHQSTVNENMPLRSLLYIGRAYERLVPPRSRYKKKIVSLPIPEFYDIGI